MLGYRLVLIGSGIVAVLYGIACPARASADTNEACPDISGRYRVYGPDRVLAEALGVLHASGARERGGMLELEGVADGELLSRSPRSGPDPLASKPTVLRQGTDFRCENGRLRFADIVRAFRKAEGDEDSYAGTSIVELTPGTGGALSVTVRFNGGQRITLYSYDSANISVPKPGTRREFNDSMRWPGISDEEFERLTKAPVQEPEAFANTRRVLGGRILGGVMLVDMELSAGSVVATLKALNSAEVIGLENRLRSASIGYETRREPIWSDRGYLFELTIRPPGANARRPSRPSLMRIEEELRKWGWPLAAIKQVDADTEGYVATVQLVNSDPVENLIARLTVYSDLLDEIKLIDESRGGPSDTDRMARLRLQVRR